MIRASLLLCALAACALESADEVDTEVALEPFHGRFGSPSIVRDGDTLHAYFAIQAHQGQTVHVTHARSLDNGATWDRVGDALPRLGSAADRDGAVWAPGVAKLSDDRWMLYYTAKRAGTEQKMCIFRAHATGPRGPFIDDYDGPLVCPEGTLWAIDAYPVRDAHGRWHLEARVDEPDGVNTISIRQLGPQGAHFEPGSEWVRLTRIHKGGWEEPVMENAAVVRLPVPGDEPHWYVFYSGGSYRDNSYAIGYADCGTGINGPCVKRTVNRPWMDSRPNIDMFGPGTPTFYREGDEMMMAVNSWEFSGGQSNPKNNNRQSMHTFAVHIGADGEPVARFVRMVD